MCKLITYIFVYNELGKKIYQQRNTYGRVIIILLCRYVAICEHDDGVASKRNREENIMKNDDDYITGDTTTSNTTLPHRRTNKKSDNHHHNNHHHRHRTRFKQWDGLVFDSGDFGVPLFRDNPGISLVITEYYLIINHDHRDHYHLFHKIIVPNYIIYSNGIIIQILPRLVPRNIRSNGCFFLSIFFSIITLFHELFVPQHICSNR